MEAFKFIACCIWLVSMVLAAVWFGLALVIVLLLMTFANSMLRHAKEEEQKLKEKP